MLLLQWVDREREKISLENNDRLGICYSYLADTFHLWTWRLELLRQLEMVKELETSDINVGENEESA